MSPKLKPLLLPQLVEARKSEDASSPSFRQHRHQGSNASEHDFSHFCYNTTTNSSSSDIASPLTPTFSARHLRYSSSSSSLDQASLSQSQSELPSSPTSAQHPSKQVTLAAQQLQYLQQLPSSAVKPAKRSLPDVEEEPWERDEAPATQTSHYYGLYSCLCDKACEHSAIDDNMFLPGEFIADYDIDYDAGFTSDGEAATDTRRASRQRASAEPSPSGITSRFGRWRSSMRRSNLVSSPTTSVSLEHAMPQVTSSRTSSLSVPSHAQARSRSTHYQTASSPATCYFSNPDLLHLDIPDNETSQETGNSLERERSLATTPLLPPLMTKRAAGPPVESPLQSPTVVPATPAYDSTHTSPTVSMFQPPRPSLSSKPSLSSFRFGGNGTDIPLPFPSMQQEHDEWSDALGHANFTIVPQPYEPELVLPDTLSKFREDWELARCNYTKHLVRTGDNYGQTSNIYALTEAKWAEIDQRWKTIHDNLVTSLSRSAPGSEEQSRSRSRGRGRMRSRAGSAHFKRPSAPASATVSAAPSRGGSPDMHAWPRLDNAAPAAIMQMLDDNKKFPTRDDEGIVGPMVRDEVMVRSHSDEGRGSRFWKNLAEKVGMRK